MPNPNSIGAIPQGCAECVVAYDADGRKGCCYAAVAIMRGGQEQVLLYEVVLADLDVIRQLGGYEYPLSVPECACGLVQDAVSAYDGIEEAECVHILHDLVVYAEPVAKHRSRVRAVGVKGCFGGDDFAIVQKMEVWAFDHLVV